MAPAATFPRRDHRHPNTIPYHIPTDMWRIQIDHMPAAPPESPTLPSKRSTFHTHTHTHTPAPP